MYISVHKTNSTRRSGTDVLMSILMDMDDASSVKDGELFGHVASSREVLIESTINCPCLTSSFSGTAQIRSALSLS